MTKKEALEKIKELEEFIKDIDRTGDKIFLLSVEEYKKYKSVIPKCNLAWWWLRSPGISDGRATYVSCDGEVHIDGHNVRSYMSAIRPALKVSKQEVADMKIGETTCKYLNHPFTKIDDDLLIATIPFATTRCFDNKSNNYETSEIRKYLLSLIKECR